MFFTKAEYETVFLPFSLIEDETDRNAGLISIEAEGVIGNEHKFCYASYCLKDMKLYDNGGYQQMMQSIRNASNETVEVTVKFKKGMPKSFKISIQSLAQACRDERLLQLELAGWGMNDRSFAYLEWVDRLRNLDG